MPPDFSSLNLVDLHYNKPVQDVMILKDCHNVVDLKTFKNNTHNNNDNEKVILGCTDIENQESKKKKKNLLKLSCIILSQNPLQLFPTFVSHVHLMHTD